jgi:hypothetical protein
VFFWYGLFEYHIQEVVEFFLGRLFPQIRKDIEKSQKNVVPWVEAQHNHRLGATNFLPDKSKLKAIISQNEGV